jgi:Tfp pilus assembly PilM family ATPase
MAASLVPERRPFDLRYAPPPSAAVEISGNRISVAAIELRGSGALVTAHAAEYLPDGAVVPSLTAANIAQREGVAAALTRVLDEIGRPRRIGLVLPDPVAKVSLVKFEQLPPRAQDLDQLVRWQARKSAPFPIDEAQVSYSPGERVDGGYEFIVSLARRSVVEEYEGLCVAAGAHAGLVDISSFNVINTLLAGTMPPAGDWLLVNVASQYVSIAILRGEHLMFFRSRGSDGEGGMADLVHQTAMYYGIASAAAASPACCSAAVPPPDMAPRCAAISPSGCRRRWKTSTSRARRRSIASTAARSSSIRWRRSSA